MSAKDIYLFDSQAGEKRLFVPVEAGRVKMYVCGMTVYDLCHIGHARGMIVFDMIAQYFRHCGYEVTYIRNITDIDDKIIKRASEAGCSAQALTERYIEAMGVDFAQLGIQKVTKEPKATDYVDEMKTLIQQLISKNLAYQGEDGDVYFAVDALPTYGRLSRRNIHQMQQGVRIAVKGAKRFPLDFVLWKMAKPGEPAWESPWGLGRPGWHSECVVMSRALLGSTFDIHGGGMDLKFPHHENECAQAAGLSEGEFARYWMHVGLLEVNHEKMSKSLNNFITIREALKQASKEVLRYFYLQGHYRSPINYSQEALLQSKRTLDGLYTALRGLEGTLVEHYDTSAWVDGFHDAMADDFNTPQALTILCEMSRTVNRLKSNHEDAQAASVAKAMQDLGGLLGLLQTPVDEYFQGGESADRSKILKLVAQRQVAREEKNWVLADQLRQELDHMGVSVEDGAGGASWRYKN